jgi:hypothetical protein
VPRPESRPDQLGPMLLFFANIFVVIHNRRKSGDLDKKCSNICTKERIRLLLNKIANFFRKYAKIDETID